MRSPCRRMPIRRAVVDAEGDFDYTAAVAIELPRRSPMVDGRAVWRTAESAWLHAAVSWAAVWLWSLQSGVRSTPT